MIRRAGEVECPAAVGDPSLNRKNKLSAVQDHFYGPDPFGDASSQNVGTAKDLPLSVPAGHLVFWAEKADRKGISAELAQKQLCGNCKAFNVTSSMAACGGATERSMLVECAKGGPPRLTASVGYCEMHEFKCSALRTCDTWVGGGPKGGGPITDYVTSAARVASKRRSKTLVARYMETKQPVPSQLMFDWDREVSEIQNLVEEERGLRTDFQHKIREVNQALAALSDRLKGLQDFGRVHSVLYRLRKEHTYADTRTTSLLNQLTEAGRNYKQIRRELYGG